MLDLPWGRLDHLGPQEMFDQLVFQSAVFYLFLPESSVPNDYLPQRVKRDTDSPALDAWYSTVGCTSIPHARTRMAPLLIALNAIHSERQAC